MGKGRGKGRGRGRGRGDASDNPTGQVGRARGQQQQQQQQQQSQPPQQQQQQPQQQEQQPQLQRQQPQQQQQQPQLQRQQPQQQQQQPQQQQQQPQQQRQQPQQQEQQPQQQRQQPQQQRQQPQQQEQQPHQQEQQPQQPEQQQPPKQQQPSQAAKGKKPKLKEQTALEKGEECMLFKPLPPRPGIGTQGQNVQLFANFFPLKIPPNTVIHQYDVAIKEGPRADDFPKRKSRLIIEQLVDENKAVFCNRPVYDGKKIMYTKEPLHFKGSKLFTVDYDDGKKRKYEITLKWAAQVEMKALQDAISTKFLPQNLINGLDLVLRHAATLKYVPIGSKFFTRKDCFDLGGGREVWAGFHVSVRPTDRWKLMLNIDVSATAFIRPIDVIEYLNETIRYDCTKTNRPIADYQRKQFAKEIKGLKIIAMHLESKRKYRVNDVRRSGANKETFKLEDGKIISVKDYFATQKKVPLKYPWLPCLHVGNKERTIYLPMEVCRIVEGQKCPRKLNDDQTANMIKFTAKRPHERKRVIEQQIVNQDLNFRANQYTKDFGIQVDNRMTHVEGRVLPPPEILYAGNSRPLTPSGGAWNMKGIKVYKGAVIKAWGFVVFDRCINDGAAGRFEQELVKMATSMGIQMGRSVYQRMTSIKDQPEVIVTEAIGASKDLDLMVVVLPGKTPMAINFYANLKRLCETEAGHQKVENNNIQNILKDRGLSTQCIQKKNALKCNPMCLAQLCLKINAKMGGVNNAINKRNQITRPVRVFNEPVMIMGADITHPGRDESSPSVAAIVNHRNLEKKLDRIVGSIDEYPSRYAVCVRVQRRRVEVIEDMKGVTTDLLKQFYKATRLKPRKIIMYRDGVDEGQFQKVLNCEMQAIQQACTSLEAGYEPAITFIVVQKRHHARFFNQEKNDTDRSGNCMPGTTIDTGVCHPVEYDYYQYGHSGIQGTSRPCHYNVLHDDSNFKPDELQALSFMLCHLYARCTRSVSIAAPAYYAHHAAFRARDHLREDDNDDTVSSSGRSDSSGELEELFAHLNLLGTVAKPHPKLMSQMYFI